MSINREQFTYLFINASSLGELALIQLAEELERQFDPAAAGAVAAMTAEERDALVAEQFRNIDMAALDGVDFDFFNAKAGEFENPVPDSPEAVPMPSDATTDVAHETNEDSGPLDLGVYLEKAYAAGPKVQARIDDCYARADLPSIEQALSEAGPGQPDLTRALSEAEMSMLLAAYRANDERLSTVVVAIRQLDFPAQS